jgi:coenzyme PQQ biosynthesis enzyme PqqE
LTHRCPLQCPYCSNPLDLERANTELTTAEWQKVMREAAQLGILQIHLSGGEPTVRRDLEDIIKTAADAGLYTNLITAAVLLTRERLVKLKEAGLDHVQISIQDVDTASENADRIAGYKGGSDKKKIVAGWVRELGMPLTINAPIHRHNIKNVEATCAQPTSRLCPQRSLSLARRKPDAASRERSPQATQCASSPVRPCPPGRIPSSSRRIPSAPGRGFGCWRCRGRAPTSG